MTATAPPSPAPIEILLRRDRLVVTASLVAVTALAWAYMALLASRMPEMREAPAVVAPQMHAWTTVDALLTFVMWAVMMVAMMVPSAAPMILVFARVKRRRAERHSPAAPTAAFVLGYLLVWTGFSAVATLAQWSLHAAALLSPMMVGTSHHLGGGLLIAAGIFQWTPLKRACLVHCRSPLHFFMTEWREGTAGALRMGLHHGAYCVGCCWVLMALLFVAGVMNLLWVAAITLFVLAEKVVPGGERLGRLAGVALGVAGLALMASA